MLRMESFLVVSFIFAIIIICELVIIAKDIWIKNRDIVNTLVLLIKRYGTILVSFVIIFSLLTSLFLVSANIKSSFEGYIEYKNYNSARSNLVDFDFAQYNGNESFYNSIDIYSQNDLDIYKNWCLDSDFFTTERMKKIVDYSKQPNINPRFSLTLIYNLLCNKLSTYVPINPVIVLLVVFLIVIGLLLLLIVNRNKMKFCFPILYTLMWIVFFCVFRISTANFLIQIFAIISTITVYVFNRNYYICL